jgi:hypothetical protein
MGQIGVLCPDGSGTASEYDAVGWLGAGIGGRGNWTAAGL